MVCSLFHCCRKFSLICYGFKRKIMFQQMLFHLYVMVFATASAFTYMLWYIILHISENLLYSNFPALPPYDAGKQVPESTLWPAVSLCAPVTNFTMRCPEKVQSDHSDVILNRECILSEDCFLGSALQTPQHDPEF